MVTGCGCESAASALKNERDEVACHEGDSVDTWAETRDLMAVDDDYAGEAEVEGAGEEGGGDCEGDEIAMRVVRTLFWALDGLKIRRRLT